MPVRSQDPNRARTSGFVFLLLVALLAGQVQQAPFTRAQGEGNAGEAIGGSPESEPPTIAEPVGVEPVEVGAPAEESPEPATSLVNPSTIVVDTAGTDATTNPCTVIEGGWAFVLVRPLIDTAWTDSNTGLGGFLVADSNSNSPAFGWDAFLGGSVTGVIVPDSLDASVVAANFYDYRDFAGAVSSDLGLTSPSGNLEVAYLCVPALAPTTIPNLTEVPSSTTNTPSESAIEPGSTTMAVSSTADAPVAPAAIAVGSSVRVAEALNLRSGPSLTAGIIAVLRAGTIATVIGGPQAASGYTWWQLSTPSGSGWSVTDYLIEQPVIILSTPVASRTVTRTPTRTPTMTPGAGIVVGGTVSVRQRLNLRSGPGTSAAVVTVMPAGTLGTVMEGPQSATGFVWWQISTSLGSGWAAAPYLQAVPGSAVPSNTPTRTATTSASTSTSTPAVTSSATQSNSANTATATVTGSATTTDGIAIGDLVRTTTRVNLRSGAGTQAAVVTVLPGGSEWPVIDGPAQLTGYTWWKLLTSSGAGWVAASYLARVGIAPTRTATRTPTFSPTASMTRTSTTSPTQTRTPTMTLTRTITPTPAIALTPAACASFGYGDIVRTNAAVNFRTQPSTSGAMIRTLAIGERGTVRGGPRSSNGYSWCQIQVGATTGWVASQYLTRVSGPLPTPNGTVTPRPSPPAPGNGSASVIYQGSASSGMIALTFDAGADRGRAAYILDVLADYGVHATFGMTGTWARDNPDLVQRMVAEGHQLINHTWSHPSFTGGSSSTTELTRTGRVDQLDRAEDVVEEVSGYQMQPYWRPPYGDINSSVLRDVYSGGYYLTIMWSCDTLGWNGATEQQILNRCMYPSGAGDIILMHVGADGLDWAAADNMIEYFQNQGLQLVTIEELLGA